MNELLTEGSVRKHLLRMAIPTSIGMFFNTMFNVVDTFYAGKLGTASLAGMSVSFSVFFILLAVTSGIGTGLTATLSNAVGKKDKLKVRALSINGLILTVAVSLALTIAGYFFAPALLSFLGAQDEAFTMGVRYVRSIYVGTLFFGINSTLKAFLVSIGQTKPYRNFLIAGFLLNLILDPLLIFGWFGLPKLGTLGLAIATIICQLAGSVYLAYKVKKMIGYRISVKALKSFSFKSQVEILSQGVPAILNMLTIAVGIFVINYYIYRFGNDASTAGYGAAVRLEQLALLPALGLNTATLALVGQNFGAGKMDRVWQTYKISLKIGIVIMAVGMALIYPFAPFLIGIFNNDPKVISEGTSYLRIEFLAFIGYIIINTCLSMLQGLKKPNYAIWIGIYRQLVMPLILFNFLGVTLGLGLTGVWWGIVFTVWTGALGMLLLVKVEFRKISLKSS
ncbi:MAG: MATE family efflux transporter [Clostridiales bacterium]|nr:MATE family efflux transporter [Clostridiales bacterium]